MARIAFVSPIPPAKSGIARYAAELLPHLEKYFDIDIYSDLKSEDGFSVQHSRQLEDYAPLRKSYDLTIYQMGNSQAHDRIYTLMVNFPGITILHDNNLHGLIYHRALVWRKEPHMYEIELAAQYGVEGLRLARIVENAGLSTETASSKPLYFTAALSSEILVITSDRVATGFSDVWDVPVRCIPLGVESRTLPSEAEISRIRRDYGVPERSFTILTAGFIESHGLRDRRIDICLQAFRKLVSTHKECKYIIAGLTRDARRDLQEWVEGLHLEKEVKLMEDSSEGTFRDLNQLSDVCLQLRYPCFAFASASILNSLSWGKPVITSDIPEYETLPTSCVWKLKPEEPYETELLYRYLDRLMTDPDLRAEMQRHASEYCTERSWPSIASQIRDVVFEVKQS
jgi:glycosyltransferase involved in cell wall biosynthesis